MRQKKRLQSVSHSNPWRGKKNMSLFDAKMQMRPIEMGLIHVKNSEIGR